MTQIGETVFLPPKDPEDSEEDNSERIRVRISIFFDGTLNNRVNTEHRVEGTDIYEKNEGQGSFENDYTNVAKMERYIEDAKDYDITLSTYIEGPGTVDEQSDKMRGYAFGTGKSGVKEKVKKGIIDVVTKITQKLEKDNIVEQLTLDVFGFSRGAAGARNFIHESLQSGQNPIKDRIVEKGYEVEKVEMCFAGLYDTVSSHGLNFSNDTETLKLDAVRSAKKVIHLVAAEEHRENFSLTTIESAGGKGQEIYLPGVHSDIGGSYVDPTSEDMVVYKSYSSKRAAEDRDQLVAAGWYHEDEIKLKTSIMHAMKPPARRTALHVRRDGIVNQYSRIPLHIMARYARETGIGIKGKLEGVEKVPSALSDAKQKIEKYVASHSRSSAEDWHHNESWLRKLRHDCMHFSARYEFGNGPRFINGQRHRKRYYG